MAFKFRDLIVTLIPKDLRRPFGDCESTSGGCGGGTCDAGSSGTVGSCTSECGCDSTSGGGGGTVGSCTSECGCDSTSGGGTVGSCTSECGGRGILINCGLSDEFLDPLKAIIDPPYLLELRLLLRHAIARSMVAKVAALEAQMVPRSIEDVDQLEKHLNEALTELKQIRQGLLNKKG